MTVTEAIKYRYSVRYYKTQPVEEEKITTLLEAARLAPSASNRQEWRFIVVREESARKKLAEAAYNQRFVGEAPVIIVCCAETDGHIMACGHQSFPIDVAIAIDHITLAAVELGLGACWIGAFNAQKVRDILGIPKHIEVVELLSLGYPADSPRKKSRLSLEEIVKYDRWS